MSSSFEIHTNDLKEIANRARKVGEISLKPSASFENYILAGIEVLNDHLGGPVQKATAEWTFYDVIQYEYWTNIDEDGNEVPIVPQNTNSKDFHQTFNNTIAALDQFRLIEISGSGYSVSKLGKTVLASLRIDTTQVL